MAHSTMVDIRLQSDPEVEHPIDPSKDLQIVLDRVRTERGLALLPSPKPLTDSLRLQVAEVCHKLLASLSDLFDDSQKALLASLHQGVFMATNLRIVVDSEDNIFDEWITLDNGDIEVAWVKGGFSLIFSDSILEDRTKEAILSVVVRMLGHHNLPRRLADALFERIVRNVLGDEYEPEVDLHPVDQWASRIVDIINEKADQRLIWCALTQPAAFRRVVRNNIVIDEILVLEGHPFHEHILRHMRWSWIWRAVLAFSEEETPNSMRVAYCLIRVGLN